MKNSSNDSYRNKKLRVAVFQLWPLHHHYFSAQIVNHLKEECEFHVFTDMRYPEHLYAQGINVASFPLSIPAKYSKHHLPLLVTKLPVVIKMLRCLQNFKPHVIHIVYSHPYAILVALLMKREVPVILQKHDPVAHEGERSLLRDLYDRLELHVPDSLIIHGDRMRNALRPKLNKKNRLFTIHHGDMNFLNPEGTVLPEPEHPPTVLFFGRVYPYKGLDVLIKAIPMVQHVIPATRFIIAGKGDWSEIFPLLRNARNVIVHPHYISDKDIPALFNQANLVVLPYKEATQSGVIPLAAAFQRAVVVTNAGSLAEYVEHEISGLVADAGNAESLSNHIVCALQNEEKRKQMAQELSKRFKNKFSFDTLKFDYLKCYNDTIDTFRRRGKKPFIDE